MLMYFRLAKREEAEALSMFGNRWSAYAANEAKVLPTSRLCGAQAIRFSPLMDSVVSTVQAYLHVNGY